MLRELTSSQFSEWIAYCEVEPFGTVADRDLFGRLFTIIATFSGVKKKSGGHWNYRDFFPEEMESVKEKVKQSPEEMKEILMGLVKKGKAK